MTRRFIHVTALVLVLIAVFSIPAAASVPTPVEPQSDAYIAG